MKEITEEELDILILIKKYCRKVASTNPDTFIDPMRMRTDIRTMDAIFNKFQLTEADEKCHAKYPEDYPRVSVDDVNLIQFELLGYPNDQPRLI